jgi:hypothetical protein
MDEHRKQMEMEKIVRDMTSLAQSLVVGGLRNQQPDLMILGKIMLTAIDAIHEPGGIQRLDELIQVARSREKESQKSVDQLLTELGISLS